MNRTSGIPSLWQTDGKAGAGGDRKVPRVILGLAVLALVAVAVLAVISSFEAGMAQVSDAIFEASPAQWSALTERHVPDYGAIGTVTNHLDSMARSQERPGAVGSGLSVRGKLGLGRIDPLRSRPTAPNDAQPDAVDAPYAGDY